MNDRERLSKLLKAGHGLISIVTPEEREVRRLVTACVAESGAHLWTWSLVDGVRDGTKPDSKPIADTENAAAGWFWLGNQGLPAVTMLYDAGDHCDDPHALRALRRLIDRARESGGTLVMVDHTAPKPGVIAAHATPFELSLPDDDEIEKIIRSTLKDLHRQSPIEISLASSDYKMIIKNLRGLPARHTEQVIRDVVSEDRVFDGEDLNRVMALKRKLISGEGVLEYVESPSDLDQIGGLGRLKTWLGERERAFDDDASKYGLSAPRGVLLLGVQGAGKSLCAKAIATAWARPLLRLDPGVLYDRYVGESERRLRSAFRQAEAMAPIVLWIDEIEKGFASAAAQSTDGGLSQRMFGALLTWMQDHTAPVFLVATANNIEALPPELLRKGRFDEIFFVDLPGAEAREKIFEIHLKKRKRDPGKYDLDRLVNASEGYSGAEIEQGVIAALHGAYTAKKSDPSTDAIVKCLEESPPLSVTMAEKIERLRAWASDRCVPAE
ncbi:MAG: AAA family ATPase [Planctomycetota bacterium]